MKKFLSLTVALAMAVAMVPATAFAKSDMKVSRTVTAESDDYLYNGNKIGDEETRVAPFLTLTADGNFKTKQQTFRLKLTNAEWIDETGAVFSKLAEDITVTDAAGNSLIKAGTTSTSAAEKALKDAIAAIGNTGDADGVVAISESDLTDAVNMAVANGYITAHGQLGIKTGSTQYTTTEVGEAVAGAISADVLKLYKNEDSKSAAAITAIDAAIVLLMANVEADYKINTDKNLALPTTNASKSLKTELAEAEEKVAPEYEKYDAEVEKLGHVTVSKSDVDNAITAYMDENGGTYADAVDAVVAVGDGTKPITPGVLISTYAPTSLVKALKDVDTAKGAIETQENFISSNNIKLGVQVKAFNKVTGDASTGSKPIDTTVEEMKKKYDEVGGDKTKFVAFLKAEGVASMADQTNLFNLTKAYVDAVAGGGEVVVGGVSVEKITDTLAMITIDPSIILPDDAEVTIPLYTKLTGGETATVEVDPRDSEFSSDSKTFAKISEGSTQSYTDGTKNFYDGDTLKTLYIDEVSAGTFELGKDITVKLSSGFKWGETVDTLAKNISVHNAPGMTVYDIKYKAGDNEFTFKLQGSTSKNPATIKLGSLIVKEDGADFGTTCKVTVSGAGVSKNAIEVGTYADFGLTLTAESKALPVIYAGSFDDDNETLKVTFEETVQNSWIPTRKTELVLPDGVKFVSVDVKKTENINMKDGLGELEEVMLDNIDGSKITIPAGALTIPNGKKAKFEAIFTVTADPTFTGDLELQVQGPGVGNETLSKTVATINSPLTVKSSVNEVIIDYRNVGVNSITITEAEAGLWAKGDKITLEVEEMQFESGITAEVVSGDMKLEKLDGDQVEVNKKNGTVTIQVKSTSSSTPAEIKIDGIQLYLDRSLPAGDYELNVVTSSDGKDKPADGKKDKDLLFANYCEETSAWDTDSYQQTSFETDSVTVLKDFVKVVTGGRDQGTSTFTTKIVVPVGSDKITAGQKEITIDAPAYINADGYTMLPVRAVIDALNGLAVVRWDDASKTCTISFGDRIFAMTVGSKTMNMNGVATALLAAPEIKNERIFLPLRDLGYALGLTDAKIQWDAATNTATLN